MSEYNIENLYFVEEELTEYYYRRNNYNNDKNITNEVLLRNALESLFFSLKGYMVSGYIAPHKFEDIVEYLERDVNG